VSVAFGVDFDSDPDFDFDREGHDLSDGYTLDEV
jgi:hypothetical protein